MSVSAKQVIIKDACIFFDLIDLGLLGSFYKLDIIVITTPAVLAEIVDESQLQEIQPFIDNGNLQIETFGLFDIIQSIVDANPGLSLTDASVLEAAARREAAILSSDKSLRNESGRRGLIVKGLLWVLEELYQQQIVTLETVLEKLSIYPEVNKRAPKTEIATLIAKLNKKQQ